MVFAVNVAAQDNPLPGWFRELNEAKNKEDRGFFLSKIANYYIGYKPDSAIYFGKIIIEEASSSENKAAGYTILGISSDYKGEFQQAIEYQLKALDLVKDSDNDEIKATVYNSLGIAYDFAGDYDKSLDYYFKALDIRKRTHDAERIQNITGNIGLVYYFKGDFNNAINYLFTARGLAEYLHDSISIASCLTNISLVYGAQKEHEKSHEANILALELYKKFGTLEDLGMAYNNCGSSLMDLKRYAEAIPYHKEAIRIRREVGDIVGVTMCLQNLGSSYVELDSIEKAEPLLIEGFELSQQQEDFANRIELANTLAALYMRKNEIAKAGKYLQIAIEENKKFAYVRAEKVYSNASLYYAKTGDYKNAYYYKDLFHKTHDSLASAENKAALLRSEFKHEFEKKEREKELKRTHEKEQDRLKREAENQRQKNIYILLISGIAGLLIVVGFVWRNYKAKKRANLVLTERNEIISKQNSEISFQKQLIEEKNKDITDSIQYAKRLQDAILPPEEKFKTIFSDYFILYRPKDIVSGDFYWIESYVPQGGTTDSEGSIDGGASDSGGNNEKIIFFAVVDCTGHGVPGGFVSIVAHNALNRAIKEFKLTDPGLILDKISDLVEESFSQHENKEIRDGMDISLAALTHSVSAESGERRTVLQWAGANNPLWVIEGKSHEAEGKRLNPNDSNSLLSLALVAHGLKEYKADKQPIGLFEDRKPFTTHTIELQKGDSVYLFTDGYADQFGGPAGKKFKYSQLKELLLSMQHEPMQVQKEKLNSVIEKWKNWPGNEHIEQIDDVCIMGVKL